MALMLGTSAEHALPEDRDATSPFSRAMAQLGTVQKPARGAPPYTRWVNRWIGRRMAAAAYVRGLTPNQVTVTSAVLTFSALALVALVRPRWWLGPVVAVLLLAGYALDSADGQLARLRGGGSRSGEWLDHVVDAAKLSVLHLVVVISLYRFTDASDIVLLVPLGYAAVANLFFFCLILIDKLRHAAATPSTTTGEVAGPGGHGVAQTIAATPADYATLCLCFALFGWYTAFVVAYTVLFGLNAAVLIVGLVRWWRQLRELDRVAAP